SWGRHQCSRYVQWWRRTKQQFKPQQDIRIRKLVDVFGFEMANQDGYTRSGTAKLFFLAKQLHWNVDVFKPEGLSVRNGFRLRPDGIDDAVAIHTDRRQSQPHGRSV